MVDYRRCCVSLGHGGIAMSIQRSFTDIEYSCRRRITKREKFLKQSAEKRWRRLKGHELLGKVIDGIEFRDGILATTSSGHAA